MAVDYQAYLASREWSLLREQVRERSGNQCERCWTAPQQAVHHMTYENVGHEALDELLAVCNPCHAWLSGKSDRDPAENMFGAVFIAGGGLRPGDWRRSDLEFVTASFFRYGGPWDNTAGGLRDADCLFGWVSRIEDAPAVCFDYGRYTELHDWDDFTKTGKVFASPEVSAQLGRSYLYHTAPTVTDAWAGFVTEHLERLSIERFVPDSRFNIYGAR